MFDGKGDVLDSWWASLPLNQWLEIVGTDFISHVTPLLPAGFRDFGTIGLKGVFHAWCGAAIDRRKGRMFFFGGGHQDSSNNGLYEFSLEKMSWRIAMAPSLLTQADIDHSRASWNASPERWWQYSQGYDYPNDFWPDGKPTAIHTYRGIEWCPEIGKVVVFGLKHFWKIDPSTGVFTMGPNSPWMSENSMVYDPIGKKFYCFFIDPYQYRGYRIYDPIADTLSARHDLPYATPRQLPLLTGRKIYLVSGSTPFTFDLDSGKVVRIADGPHPALYVQTGDYSSRTGKIYVMNAPTGLWGSMSALDPESGLWEQYTPSGTLPSPGNANPPYSKFRIYERANGVFMVLFHLANANLRLVRIA